MLVCGDFGCLGVLLMCCCSVVLWNFVDLRLFRFGIILLLFDTVWALFILIFVGFECLWLRLCCWFGHVVDLFYFGLF